MQLYNTMTRRKETFTPLVPGRVGLYACGITAYDYCHIGHARSAVVFDVLVRYLRHLGFTVDFIRNFTDVDDKIINRANRDGVPGEVIAARFIEAFHQDMDRLGVMRATHEPKATEHIDDMIQMCRELIAKGHAYVTPSGDVYFRVRSFVGYGKLSGRSVDELQSGARIAPGEEKEDPLDFALWKAAKPGEPFWESPFSPGRPGWHIECSAMSEKYLPLPFDIHGGGQDLIFPHHENEIAQTEAATGKELAKFWVHNGFVQINSEKMSKSLGNFTTIRDILENYLPETLRYFLLTRQYRNPIDFTPEAMEEAEKNVKRLYETLALAAAELAKELAKELAGPAPSGGGQGGGTPSDLAEELAGLESNWRAAMDDDLNTASALGHMNNMLRLAGRIMETKALKKSAQGRSALQRIFENTRTWGMVLGLLQSEPAAFLAELKDCKARRMKLDIRTVDALMEERLTARARKDFAAADALRGRLLELGVEVRDTPEGAIWDIP